MDNVKWNKVLLEWINCLKLCKNVENISELRTGEFFNNLQKALHKKQELLSSSQPDVLTFIFTLLDKQYPQFVFKNKSEIHLSDLSIQELKAVTSLLIHYTCIYDRKDVLTSPLCHFLSRSTQLIIRNYLQKINHTVTNSTLNEIIIQSVTSSEISTNQWLSVSTLNHKPTESPLQDFLKTPISKLGRLQEKDRLIAALKSDLELERYEKGDLQEELKSQLDKCKNHEINLTRKNSEISRLKTEVAALENRTPPHFQDPDSRELQRRLRAEIESLEQYSRQLENELEEVRRVRDCDQVRLNNFEAQSKLWQDKFYEVERNFEELSEKSLRQTEQISCLKSDCSELTGLLDEYRNKRNNDSAVFESFVNPVGVEDLACSVVEVQLLDARKTIENLNADIEDLRGVLKKTQDEHISICQSQSLEISNLQTNLTSNACLLENCKRQNLDLEKQLVCTKDCLKSLQEELDKTFSENQRVDALFMQLKENFVKLQEEKSDLEQKHEDTKENFNITKQAFDLLQKQHFALKTDLKNTKTDKFKLETELIDTKQEILKLQEVKETLLKQINLLETEHRNVQQDLSTAMKNLNLAEKHTFDLEQCLKALEIKHISLKNASENEKIELETRLNGAKEEICDLRESQEKITSQIKDLESAHENLQQQLLKTTLDLNLAEKRSEDMILENEKSRENFAKLVTEKAECEQGNVSLQVVLQELKQELSAKIKILQSELEESNIALETTLENLRKLDKERQDLKSQLIGEKEETSNLLESQKKLTTKINILECEREKSLNSMQEKHVVLETTLENLKKLDKEKQDLERQLIGAKEETSNLLESQEQLTTKIKHLESMQENLQQQLLKITFNLNLAEKGSEDARTELEHLKLENQKLTEDFANLETDKEKCEQEKILLEMELSGTREDIFKLQETEQELSTKINLLECEHEKSLNSMQEKHVALETTLENLKKLDEEKQDLERQLIGSKEQICDLSESQEKLTTKIKHLESMHENLQQQLLKITFNLNLAEKGSEDARTELEHMKLENQRLTEDLANLETEKKKCEQEKVLLEMELSSTREDIFKLQETEQELSGQLIGAKEQISNLLESQEKLTTKIKHLESAHENLQQQLLKTTLDLNLAEKRSEDMILEYEKSRENFAKLETEKAECEQGNVSLQLELQELKQELSAKIKILKSELEESHVALETTLENLTKLDKERQDLERQLISEKEETSNLLESQEKLTTKIEHLESMHENLQQQLLKITFTLNLAEKGSEDARTELEHLKLENQKSTEDFANLETEKKKCEHEKVLLEMELSGTREDIFKLQETKQELSTKINLLECESEKSLNSMQEKHVALETTLENLKKLDKEKQDLESQLIGAKEETSNLLESQEKLTTKIKHLESMHENLQQQLLKITFNLNLAEKGSEDARTELEHTKLENQKSTEDFANLETEKKKCEEEKVLLQMELSGTREEIFKLQETKQELSGQLIGAKEQISNLLESQEKLTTKINHMELAHEIVQQQTTADLNRAEKCLENMVLENKKSRIDFTNLESEKGKCEQEKVGLEMELNGSREYICRLQETNQELATKMKLLECDLKNNQEELVQTIENLKTSEEKLSNLEGTLSSLSLLKESYENAKNDLDTLETERKRCEQAFETRLNEEIFKRTETERELTIKINLLQCELENSTRKPELEEATEQELTTKINLLESELETIQLDCEKLKEGSIKLVNEKEQMLLKVQELKDEKSCLEEKLQCTTQEREILDKKLEIQEYIQAESRERNKMLEDTVLDYEMTISGLKKVIDDNSEALSGFREDKKELENQLERLQETEQKTLRLFELNFREECENLLFNTVERFVKEKLDKDAEIEALKESADYTAIDGLEDGLVKVCEKIDVALKIKDDLAQKLGLLESENVALKKEKNTKNKSKENVLGLTTKTNVARSIEDDLKKENMQLKKKVVLIENAKINLERILKEVRAEKVLAKEEYEKTIKDCEDRYKNYVKQETDDKKVLLDLQNVRAAYSNVMSINSKLELENISLRKIIEDRNNAHVKEAYERLLEENNKLVTDSDTVKYKRMRDKEEFVRLLKKEREEWQAKEHKKVQQIRAEYEAKLEKMKDKMLKLYREERNKEVQQMKAGQTENVGLIKTISDLKSDLFEAEQKIQMLEMERDILKTKMSSVEKLNPKHTYSRVTTVTSRNDNRRATTLPRQLTEEITISRRTSFGVQMEDEEDLFNDKYLTDLKEGRCILPFTDRESTSTRCSELAWRNSLVPAHLKSSYPAETQFVSPGRFKDEEMKSGHIAFEDSLCKLLPGEKPKNKKDFGTTSYKRPGPPTPSKNGGRLSLQGNEIHPLREHVEVVRTPKKSTPSRIKALFTSRSNRESSGSQNLTPSQGRRLNIFRRPR